MKIINGLFCLKFLTFLNLNLVEYVSAPFTSMDSCSFETLIYSNHSLKWISDSFIIMYKIGTPLLLFHNHHFAKSGIRPARIQFMRVDFEVIFNILETGNWSRDLGQIIHGDKIKKVGINIGRNTMDSNVNLWKLSVLLQLLTKDNAFNHLCTVGSVTGSRKLKTSFWSSSPHGPRALCPLKLCIDCR